MFRYLSHRRVTLSYRLDFGVNPFFPNKESCLDNFLGCVRSLASFTIHSPTADEVIKDVNLSNKTCLITGANSGIGLEMTRCLSSRDCKVLMACRNPYAAKMVAKNMCKKNHNLKIYEINLSSFQSVKKCSEEILEDQNKLDIVILNAAVFGLPWTVTKDSFETIFQVNFLSQYMLLMRLEHILAPDARVVFVSSESHRNVNWANSSQLQLSQEMLSLPQHEYTSIKAYNISKLCGILCMHYLGYRWMNTSKSVFCAHPGSFVKTKLCRNWWPYEALYTAMKPFSKSIREAASTPLYCATAPELASCTDGYYKDCRRYDESDLAKDLQLSFRIQNLTEAMICEGAPDKNEEQFETIEKSFMELKESPDESPLVANYSG